MSRLAKKPIVLPEQTSFELTDGVLKVKGPLGQVQRVVDAEAVSFESAAGGREIRLKARRQNLDIKALLGTYAAHLKNMIRGVNQPFEKKLVIEGIGFRAELKGKNLSLNLGFSHRLEAPIPEGLSVNVEKEVITVRGLDKELVGQWSAKIRALKKPEPYKVKGIRYQDEVVRRKQGKRSV